MPHVSPHVPPFLFFFLLVKVVASTGIAFLTLAGISQMATGKGKKPVRM